MEEKKCEHLNVYQKTEGSFRFERQEDGTYERLEHDWQTTSDSFFCEDCGIELEWNEESDGPDSGRLRLKAPNHRLMTHSPLETV